MSRNTIKGAIQKILPSNCPPIIVASMGRSGSTVVYSALVDGMARERFGFLWRPGRRIVRDDAWDLSSEAFHSGVVYKTHGLAEELPRTERAKVVFLYGSPIEAAISVVSCRERYGQQWIECHFQHLRASGKFQDIFDKDVLRFGDQIHGWLGATDIDVLGLRYETLWENIEVLSDFVGFPVQLPKRTKRSSRSGVSPEHIEALERVYADLEKYISDLPDTVYVSS